MMNPEDIMNLDKKRFKKDFPGGDGLYPVMNFSPLQDGAYPFKREKLTCVVCNPMDKVYTMKCERSLYEMYKCMTLEHHYTSPGYTEALERHRENSEALDLDISEFGDILDIVSQTVVYPDSRTDRLVDAPVSLICVGINGVKYLFYGTVMIFGKDMTSVPSELQWYMLSNTMLMQNDGFGYTVACVIYEDSMKEIIRNELSKDVIGNDWKVYT